MVLIQQKQPSCGNKRISRKAIPRKTDISGDNIIVRKSKPDRFKSEELCSKLMKYMVWMCLESLLEYDLTKINFLEEFAGKNHSCENTISKLDYSKKALVWDTISWYGVGPIVRINGKIDWYQYLGIPRNIVETFVFEFIRINWTIKQDIDPKHTAKVVRH